MISLPKLPYAYDALSPTISSDIMTLHHDRHHARYVEVTNSLLAENGLESASLEEIVAEAEKRGLKKLFNNSAQSWNHAFFWESMSASKSAPSGDLAAAIDKSFGGLAELKAKFVPEGVDHFASGWVWLAADGADLKVLSTHDAGTLATDKSTPLLLCDVWEHAYYLDYKQDRKSFIEAWFDNVANWGFAASQYAAAKAGQKGWAYPAA